MKNINNLSKITIFFIGIGGISMSGLAKIVKNCGGNVQGSDITENEEVLKLRQIGVDVHIGHNEKNITNDIDIVVYSGAIGSDNVEIIKAKKLNIKLYERSEFLGILSENFKNVIAISGTHGKTTTTSLVGWIFQNAKLFPTIHLGGNSIDLGSNTIIGKNDYFIVEACEYRESFKYLNPQISVITNIEKDHLDYYKNYKNLHNAFQKFANNSSVVVLKNKAKINHISTIKNGIDYKIKNIVFSNLGYDFDVYKYNKKYLHLRLNVLGKYNIENALNALIVADFYNIDKEIIASAISSFRGVDRRNEVIGILSNTPIIIDYAHHPTEIKCSTQALKDVYNNVLYIFQPHTYSRTLTLMKDFVNVLTNLDNLIIFKTYSARENEIMGGRAEDLHLNLSKSLYAENIKDVIDYIEDNINNYNCVVILGAGDLGINIKKYLNKYNKQNNNND